MDTIVGIKTNEKFSGKEKDKETGLYYFGARYMDAGIGRFISPDPVMPVDPRTSKTNESLLLNPQKLNRYSYGLNNPYRYVDPEGKNVWDLMDIGFFAYDLYKFYKELY
jgi:RHS repeat-associated protein